MVNVAVCQLALEFGDLEGNRKITSDAIVAAARGGAKIIVLPELSNTGYHFAGREEGVLLGEASDGATIRVWCELAREHGVVVVAGFCELDEADVPHNSAAVIDPTGLRAVYRKAHLWDQECLVFEAGNDRPPLVETEFGNIVPLICYDIEFPEWVRLAALLGADLIAVPTNWPWMDVPDGERSFVVANVQAASEINQVFFAVASRARQAERGHEFTPASVITGPEGYPLVPLLPDGGPGIVHADCDLPAARVKQISPHNDIFGDRRVDLYD